MSKEKIIKQLLEENVEPGIKYHSSLPPDISPWYVYTMKSGHRVLCVPEKSIQADMTEADYGNSLVSAPVKTVLRGYTVRDGFVIVDCEYSADTGFAAEQEDREFDPGKINTKYILKVGELYLPGATSWPEAAEYNYFSGNHELRFFVKNPTRYITEVMGKMPVQLGLFTQDDIILLIYRFTDYKKHLVPVHGYSPFSIHLVPENMRTLPEMPDGDEHEEMLRIHLVDADTGILKAARTVHLSPGFSAALCLAIIEQEKKPLTADYNERLQKIDGMYPVNDTLMNHCKEKCSG
ncbi:MAG TPA: hypothetical protein PK514_11775 [Spirochaetota bacterium]|nr:hypothetical protein [Spirochaetota bacterium]